MADEVIIRDPSGTEHVFPPGFDPKRAAAIVRKNLGIPDQPASPAQGGDVLLENAKNIAGNVVDWLPAIGGMTGGLIGGIGGTVAGMGIGGVPGAIGGAAVGGVAGEGFKQAIRTARGLEAPRTPTEAFGGMATQAAIQGGSEVVGAGIGRVLTKAAPALMESALKPLGKGAVRAAIKGDVHPAVKTLLDEGINVTPGGMEKLNRILMATNADIKNAVQSVSAFLNPFKVTAKLGETAKTFASQVNPEADLRMLGEVGNEFLRNNPSLTVQEAQAIKTGTYKQLAGKYGELKGAEIEGQKALARGLKEEIANEVGPELIALNAKEGAVLEAREALGKRLAVSGRQNPMGLAGLAISHPVTFLVALMDRSPAVKSMLARGAYGSAGAAAKVSPQLIRGAVAAIVSGTPPAGPE